MRTTIFTTGAFLEPRLIKNDNGNDYWVWVVSEFIDDSYNDGEVFAPVECANNLEELLRNQTEDDQ